MKAASASLALLLLVPVSSWANLWQCEAKGVYRVDAAGKFAPAASPFGSAEIGDIFYFDESSGIVRRLAKRFGKVVWELKFETWQQGSAENSAIGVYTFKGAASNPAMLIRVSAFSKPTTFSFADENGDFVTGRCQSIASR